MNRSIVIYVLGYILKTEGVLMSLPCLIAYISRKKKDCLRWYQVLQQPEPVY